MNKIHPLATVSPDAKLGDNIEIGPYAFIDADVEIGDGCKILPHAVIFSYVKMGCDCTVFPGAVVGAVPQDLKYEGEITRVEIGDRWGWCTGMTQRNGMGREEGGGFRMGNTCIPVADSF